jgi:hypothetical protein
MARPNFLNIIFILSLALSAETSSSFESRLRELDQRDRFLSESHKVQLQLYRLQLILRGMDTEASALHLVSHCLLFQCFL